MRIDAAYGSQRGFSLIEVLAVVAITTAVILTTAGAVANALHGAAEGDLKMSLEDDAFNALADVRAATAYGDPTAAGESTTVLAKLAGKSSTATTTLAAGITETLTVSVAQTNGGTTAQATATANGVSVTDSESLSIEAPTPGSTVDVVATP